MIPAASGEIRRWFKLTEAQRADALEHTRRSWGDEDWADLPEHARIFAALTLPMVRPFDRVLDTVKCLNCRDSGFQQGHEYGVWFCSVCEKGLVLEAGHWRRLRFPEVRGHRVASAAGKQEFEAYVARKPYRGELVRKAIADLVERDKARDEGGE